MNRHGIEDEPHFRPAPSREDIRKLEEAERRAAELLRREATTGKASRQQAEQSVFEEPFTVISAADGSQPRDADAVCSNCGYALRGLTMGDACPECGYREPQTFADWLRIHQARVSEDQSWFITFAAAAIGGPQAIITVLLAMMAEYGLMAVIVFGPVAEEVMKVGAVMMIVETRPYFFRHRIQIFLAALFSAFGFAVIENILYLNVYIPEPSAKMVLWRWTVCVMLHVGCTAIAVQGVARVWTATMTQGKSPDLGPAMRWLAAAIILHGCYNAVVTILPWAGMDF